jgi:serine/threonine-protein kinase 19
MSFPSKRPSLGGEMSNKIKRGRPNERDVDWGADSDDDESKKNVDLVLAELDQLDNNALLYSILTCVRQLRAQFRAVCPYFVSKTLVYDALVGNDGNKTHTATEVDTGLEELKQKKVVMALYMPSVGDDAIIETSEYREIARRALIEGSDLRLRRAGQFLRDEIVGKYQGPTFQLPTSRATAEHLDILVKHEMLLRMPGGKLAAAVDSFGFKVPGSGQIVRSIIEGRNELVSKIKRKKHGEMLDSKVRKEIKLKKSSLGIAWHLADLVGSGLVHVVPTTVGPLLRVVTND